GLAPIPIMADMPVIVAGSAGAVDQRMRGLLEHLFRKRLNAVIALACGVAAFVTVEIQLKNTRFTEKAGQVSGNLLLEFEVQEQGAIRIIHEHGRLFTFAVIRS